MRGYVHKEKIEVGRATSIMIERTFGGPIFSQHATSKCGDDCGEPPRLAKFWKDVTCPYCLGTKKKTVHKRGRKSTHWNVARYKTPCGREVWFPQDKASLYWKYVTCGNCLATKEKEAC